MCDYISRQDAIETIHKTIYEIFGYQDGKVFTETDELLLMVNKLLCKKIREIPSEDVVERKTGEWIEGCYYPCVCSVCGTQQDFKAKFLFSYCPNCGARMGGKK